MRKLTLGIAAVIIVSCGIFATFWAPSASGSAEKVINFEGTTTGWMSTSICFNKGDDLVIAVTGTVKHSWASGFVGPEGNPNSMCGDGCKPHTKSCNVGALVSKIGNGAIRCVGSAISGETDSSGEIMFAINDAPTQDNEGSWQIMLQGGHLCPGSESKKKW